jgi:hypothetical protein
MTIINAADFNAISDRLAIVYQRATGTFVDNNEITTNKITSPNWLDLYDRIVICATKFNVNISSLRSRSEYAASDKFHLADLTALQAILPELELKSQKLLLVGGKAGGIAYSYDGVNWTSATTNPMKNAGITIKGICGKSGLQVAVGDNYVMTSSDGLTWTRKTGAPWDNTPWIGAAASENAVVIVSNTRIAYRTTDGITWTDISSTFGPALPGGSRGGSTWPQELLYGSGRFVVCGSHYVNDQLFPAVGYSTDGIIWNASSGMYTGAMDPYGHGWSNVSIAYAGDRWYAKGEHTSDGSFYNGVFTSSNNAQTWTEFSPPIGYTWNGSLSGGYGNGKYILSNLNITSSTDGVNFTSIGLGPINDMIFSSTINLFVAGTSSNIATSPDGITWTARTSPFNSSDSPNRIAFG